MLCACQVAAYAQAALATPGVTARCGGEADPRVAAATASHGEGHWFAPTVLEGCGLQSAVAQEETFGPLVTLHRFDTESDAIAAANCTRYGLAASVWTEDVSRAHAVAAALDAGTVWVNCWLHRQLHMPFGGSKASGVGREGGDRSLDFFSETTAISLKLGSRVPPPMPGLSPKPQPQPQPRPRESTQGPQRRGLSTAAEPPSRSTASAAGLVPSAPSPLGAYSHARRVGELLFVAGIGPRDPTTDAVPGGRVDDEGGVRREYDAAAQTKACIANVEVVLRAHGLTLEHVVDVQASKSVSQQVSKVS